MGRFSPSFLIRNKSGTYYFRYIPPKIFTGYADKRFEIRRSLQTSFKSHAVLKERQRIQEDEHSSPMLHEKSLLLVDRSKM
jgi:hypothetical protein